MITAAIVVLAIVLCLLLVYSVVQIVSFLYTRRVLNKIPGPHSNYLIGNINDIFKGTDMFSGLRRLSSQYKIYRLWLSYMGAVCLTLPEDVESAISSTTNMEKSQAYEPLLLWLNTGLLTSSGHKWRVRRKILTPTFHFNILQQFIGVFIRQTNVFLKELEPLSEENSVNITPYITSFTLRTICETAMGIQFDLERDLESRYEKAIHKMGDMLTYRVARPWLYINSIYRLTPSYWKQLYITAILHSFSKTVINKRTKNFVCEFDSSSEDTKKRTIMLDMLLLARKRSKLLNLDGIREEVDTFIFEGHDTTSISLGFTLMLLANHPEIQEKVYEEAIEILGPLANTPTYQDLQNLSYLEMCIKESLRLYPSVPLIGRISSKEFITASGYTIPKNVQVIVHIYDLHRNPDIYPDPEKFDPNRFSPENTLSRHPFAYLPFSGGPRNCIGQKFAMLEMKTVISGILRKYVLKPVDTPDTITLTQDFMLRSKDGIKLRLKPRAKAHH